MKAINWSGFTDNTLPLPGDPIPGKFGYRRVHADEYHAFPAVNAGLLKCRTAAEMYAQLTTEQKDTDALTVGTLVHMVTLEPERSWAERFALADIPINERTGLPFGEDTKKGKAAWEQARIEHPGKIIVTAETLKNFLAECSQLRSALTANADAMSELEGAEFEVTGILWHPKWNCWVKWRPDILASHCRHLCDVKTSSRHPADFHKDCWQFGYFTQATWYSHCHELLLSKLNLSVTKFPFLVLSKEDTGRAPRPVMCRVLDLPMVPGLHGGVDKARQSIGLPEGLSRVDIFLECVREFIERGMPTDFHALRKCWPAYEFEAGEKSGRFTLAD